tara:strand:- start:5651 stop:6229 length:579 start_codon:yes stop_codon:yes gene_type:complete
MDRNILIIGAGGIGSHLIRILESVVGDGTKEGLYSINVSDPDTVEEKNLTYQDFKKEDIGKKKVTCMKKHSQVNGANPYPILTETQLKGYDLVVCCVDNLDARRLLYRSQVKWLDLRSQGRNAAFISYKADPSMYDTMLAGPDGSFSCQGDSWDGSSKGLHFMHIAIAGMAAEWIQRWFNGESVNDFMVVNV